MPDGLIDTSVVIDWDVPETFGALPDSVAVSAITLAELAAGPHLAADPLEKARRQARLQQIESLFDPLDVDTAARSYGLAVAAVVAAGRSHHSRIPDLLIASIAHSNHLPLYTRNPGDFRGLATLITVVSV